MSSGEFEKLLKAAKREQVAARGGCVLSTALPFVVTFFAIQFAGGFSSPGIVVLTWLFIQIVILALVANNNAFNELQRASYVMIRQHDVGEDELECVRFRIASMKDGFRVKPGRKFVLKMLERMDEEMRIKFLEEFDDETRLILSGRIHK